MTPQEALKLIDKMHDYPCPYGIGGTAWMYIRNCIEKQIPKKPIEDGYYDEPCVCPNCGSNVVNEADNDYQFDYCYHCGQALDWSEDNA